MSRDSEIATHERAHQRSEFEARTQAVFSASIDALDGRTRSRLNQARHAALAELRARRSPLPRAWMSLSGVAAAVLLALWMTLGGVEQSDSPAAPPFEDFELVAESPSLELLEDVEFYAWVAREARDPGSG